MMFKLKFADRQEYVQAKNEIHLREEYIAEYGDDYYNTTEIKEISETEAKGILISLGDGSEESSEVPLSTIEYGDDFMILASDDWDKI